MSQPSTPPSLVYSASSAGGGGGPGDPVDARGEQFVYFMRAAAAIRFTRSEATEVSRWASERFLAKRAWPSRAQIAAFMERRGIWQRFDERRAERGLPAIAGDASADVEGVKP